MRPKQSPRFTAAHVADDSAAINAMFSADAKFYPPGADAAIGRPATQALTVEYLKAGIRQRREENTDFYGNLEQVIDADIYLLSYGPDPVAVRGEYFNVCLIYQCRRRVSVRARPGREGLATRPLDYARQQRASRVPSRVFG